MSTPFTCQLHFRPSPDGRYGKLIDPNGHSWDICSECINSLWQDKQPYNQADEPEQEVADTEYRIKHLENALLDLHYSGRIPVPPICFNVSCGKPNHPHWSTEPQIDWSREIIYHD
jgi:hypothetical protein